MLCTVYYLRRLGSRLQPNDAFYGVGRTGVVVFDKTKSHMEHGAWLYDLETNAEIGRLHRARIVKVRDGGVLIAGVELHFRGLKSKGEERQQTWWCVPLSYARRAPPAPPPAPAPVVQDWRAQAGQEARERALQAHRDRNPSEQENP